MSELLAKQLVEAAIFASTEPLPISKLSVLLDESDDITSILEELTADYQERGIELVKVASGYRFQVRQQHAQSLLPLYEKSPPRYTRALLETLALIAYRQPTTRGEIEQVRGVAVSSHIIRTLQERDWIKVVGHRDVPGKPALLATTNTFLDYFNLKSVADLPPLEEVVDLAQAEQTLTAQLNLLISPQESNADGEAAALTEATASETNADSS